MGLFSSECKHCGSKEHSSSDCPHGIFSSKCKHCGSVEHSSSDCPHGIFSSKCRHCGSVDHSSDDCPQGIFSSKCKHCGSTEHSSNDCPHGMFSTKCKHCGSVNHSSNDCPQGGIFSTRSEQSYSSGSSSDSDATTWIIKIVFIIAAGAFVLYLAFLALIFAVLISPLALLIYYLYNKRENKLWAIGAIIISGFIFSNLIANGFLTEPLEGDKSLINLIGLGYFIVFIVTIGFYFEKYSSINMPLSENGNFFTQKEIKKRRPLIAGLGLLLIGFYSVFSFVDFSNSNSYSIPKNNTIQNTNRTNNSSTTNQNNATITNNNSNEKPIQNSNTNNNTTNVSNGELAVISDADGYTNLRKGKGTSYSIVKKIYSNEKFSVFPSNEKWWKVKTNNGTIGYIFHNRVDLLNKEFYIINVTATKTETKALSEVKKLKNKGYKAGHLWIPNYKSLSGANFYSVYIGQFNTQKECIREIEKYRKINGKAYGTLVSQENKRVEIRSASNIKTIDNYHKINTSNGIYSKASKRILKDDELTNMSKSNLKIMRNEIFARYGHSFISGGKMEQYFNNQNWYKNKNIDATMLITEIEKRNIKLIQKYE